MMRNKVHSAKSTLVAGVVNLIVVAAVGVSFAGPAIQPPELLNTSGIVTNVMDYGAHGDSTTDDRAAIISAIDAIGHKGGTLYFPPGRWYRLSDNIVIKQDSINVIAYGAGVWCNEKTTTGGVFGFWGTATDRLQGGGVYGMTISCKPDSTITQNENAFFAVWSQGVTFRDCHILYANRKGICDHHSLGTKVMYNRIDSAGFAGISMEFGALPPAQGGRQQIIGNTVGVVFRRDVGPRQHANIVNDSLFAGSGISVSSISPSYGFVDGPLIRDNHIGYATKAGIYLYLTRNAVVSGNTIDTARFGIVTMQSIHPTVTYNAVAAADSAGVWEREPKDSISEIRDNKIDWVKAKGGAQVRVTGTKK
jgi:hypothetical protein